MKSLRLIVPLSAAIALAACAAGRSTPADTTAAGAAVAPTAVSGDVRTVKSRDGRFDGEIIGKGSANSKFAKLQIGMSMDEVQRTMGQAPDRSHSYESGKRWIPFYYGNDARRVQALYKGEGCLILTGGNVFGGAGDGELTQIQFDASGACYQP